MEGHSEGAGHVIVAGARGAEPARRVGYERRGRSAGEDAQRFERGGHVRTFQTVVSVLSLDHHFQQALGFQAIEVNAGRGRAHVGDDGEFRGGSCVAVRQGVQHAGASRLADGGSDPGDGGVRVRIDSHIFIINEVSMYDKLQY